MIIAIDHGNKQIKSAHKTFVSGLLESDTQPPFGDSILKYKGKYYTLSEQRIPYMRDKSVNNKFFILSLFAIAYEIEEEDCYSPNDIIDVQLLIGLPPAHYGTQYERFEKYFTKGGDIIDFEFRNKPYSIYIDEVMSFPQAYAAAMPVFGRIRNFPKATIIDIGGFTADYLQIKNGQADLSVCDSLENGVIMLYNRIKSKVNADFDLLLEESDIDMVIRGENTDFDEDVVRIIEQQAQEFINDLIGKLRERMMDLRTGKAVFVGGGSILLRKYIESSDKVGYAIFVDEVSANAKGYELLYRAYKARR
jgi:plasmid segregation protein ParM